MERNTVLTSFPCWYYNGGFCSETALHKHQKAAHFMCPHCFKCLATAQGMARHAFKVHGTHISKVPNALAGKDNILPVIMGMKGVPCNARSSSEQGISTKKAKTSIPASFAFQMPPAGTVVSPAFAAAIFQQSVVARSSSAVRVPLPGYRPEGRVVQAGVPLAVVSSPMLQNTALVIQQQQKLPNTTMITSSTTTTTSALPSYQNIRLASTNKEGTAVLMIYSDPELSPEEHRARLSKHSVSQEERKGT